jgi:RNA polymerase sigma-70 factor (ECF subfamily)
MSDNLEKKFEELYEEHVDNIFRHLSLRLNNRDRALDLTQDVFLKTWDYVLAGKEIRHTKAFLYRVARNLFINEIRSNAIRKTISLDMLTSEGFQLANEASDDTYGHDEHAEVLKKIGQIPETYREPLMMRYVEGLSVIEIAHILEITPTNASVKIHRGLAKLKLLYDTKE